jgi:hypothetical protein
MSLQAKLDAFKADFEAGKPPYSVPYSATETMHRATAGLIASGAAEHALTAGDKIPIFILSDPEAKKISSAVLLSKGPIVISLYRGV